MNTKRKPGRPQTLFAPNATFALVFYNAQIERLDRIAATRRVSRSQVAREALDMFLAVNSDLVTTPVDASSTRSEVPA